MGAGQVDGARTQPAGVRTQSGDSLVDGQHLTRGHVERAGCAGEGAVAVEKGTRTAGLQRSLIVQQGIHDARPRKVGRCPIRRPDGSSGRVDQRPIGHDQSRQRIIPMSGPGDCQLDGSIVGKGVGNGQCSCPRALTMALHQHGCSRHIAETAVDDVEHSRLQRALVDQRCIDRACVQNQRALIIQSRCAANRTGDQQSTGGVRHILQAPETDGARGQNGGLSRENEVSAQCLASLVDDEHLARRGDCECPTYRPKMPQQGVVDGPAAAGKRPSDQVEILDLRCGGRGQRAAEKFDSSLAIQAIDRRIACLGRVADRLVSGNENVRVAEWHGVTVPVERIVPGIAIALQFAADEFVSPIEDENP